MIFQVNGYMAWDHYHIIRTVTPTGKKRTKNLVFFLFIVFGEHYQGLYWYTCSLFKIMFLGLSNIKYTFPTMYQVQGKTKTV